MGTVPLLLGLLKVKSDDLVYHAISRPFKGLALVIKTAACQLFRPLDLLSSHVRNLAELFFGGLELCNFRDGILKNIGLDHGIRHVFERLRGIVIPRLNLLANSVQVDF